jgi:hypothetical protein
MHRKAEDYLRDPFGGIPASAMKSLPLLRIGAILNFTGAFK